MLANFINSLLIYNDATTTDNPNLRVVDWTRKMAQVLLNSATSRNSTLAPGEVQTLFDGTRANPLDGTSVLSLGLLSGSSSMYRMEVTAGTSGFRTPRSVSGITTCVVSINNGVTASFNFAGSTLTGVTVGDIMRIRGLLFGDTAPFAFNSINAGLWKVIGVSGSVVTAIRPSCQTFSAAAESVAVATSDVSFYSADGIQKGDKIAIDGTFSVVTQRIYEVQDVTPTTIDFISAMPLPSESVTYVPGTIAFYLSAKKFAYIEVNQEASVRFNGDTSDNNKVTPFVPGSNDLVGFCQKTGDAYKIVVVNRSVNTMNVQYILGD